MEDEASTFGELVFERIRVIERALAQYETATEKECEREFEVQKASIPKDVEWGRLKTTTVRAADGRVTGPIETFSEYLVALKQSTEKGLA